MINPKRLKQELKKLDKEDYPNLIEFIENKIREIEEQE